MTQHTGLRHATAPPPPPHTHRGLWPCYCPPDWLAGLPPSLPPLPPSTDTHTCMVPSLQIPGWAGSSPTRCCLTTATPPPLPSSSPGSPTAATAPAPAAASPPLGGATAATAASEPRSRCFLRGCSGCIVSASSLLLMLLPLAVVVLLPPRRSMRVRVTPRPLPACVVGEGMGHGCGHREVELLLMSCC